MTWLLAALAYVTCAHGNVILSAAKDLSKPCRPTRKFFRRKTMTFTEHNANGLIYLTAPTIGARHAFTTRAGGVSEGGFASLNLSFGRGDPAENVLENYRRLGTALGIDPFSAAFTKQVHGTAVRVVTDADRVSPADPAPCAADGLVTNVPGLPIFCFIADCVPVLLCDETHGVIGAVHCGWRSSVADILGVAVGKMVSLGAQPRDIHAAIGASIGRCCFETDGDVPDALRAYLGADAEEFVFPDGGKYHVELRGANARRLIQLGLRPDGIAVSDECTMCECEKYWSHRHVRGGQRGSQCAVITL